MAKIQRINENGARKSFWKATGRSFAVMGGLLVCAFAFNFTMLQPGSASASDAQNDSPNSTARLCKPQNNDAEDAGKQLQSSFGVTSPPSQTRCAIQGVHTDAMSMYITKGDNPRLLLKSKADNVYPGSDDGVRSDTASLAFILPDKARQSTSGMSAAYDFLRTENKDQDFWYIPQTQDPNVLWAGFSTEALSGNAHINSSDQVLMRLESFRGPGQMVMWSNNDVGGIHKQMGSPGTGFPGNIDFISPSMSI